MNLQARHDVVNVVHDALKKIFRFFFASVDVFTVRERRIVLEVEFWNEVETAHE